jgi:hypothetical protein
VLPVLVLVGSKHVSGIHLAASRAYVSTEPFVNNFSLGSGFDRLLAAAIIVRRGSDRKKRMQTHLGIFFTLFKIGLRVLCLP